jgi:hypothetical protein
VNPNEKRCSGECRKTYRKAAGSLISFDPHIGKPDGLQPFCRTCDWDAKHKAHRGWKRLRKEAAKRGLSVSITEFEYRKIIECNQCRWCKGQLLRWGGYWVDRTDSKKHYEPGNVVPCCRWCNHYKNDLPIEVWEAMLSGLLMRFGVGSGDSRRLDWSSLGDKYACTRPDISRLEVRDAGHQLLLSRIA